MGIYRVNIHRNIYSKYIINIEYIVNIYSKYIYREGIYIYNTYIESKYT